MARAVLTGNVVKKADRTVYDDWHSSRTEVAEPPKIFTSRITMVTGPRWPLVF